MTTESLTAMSSHELLAATVQAAGGERRATAELLALLAEVDSRRLYLSEGCSSLFAYCTQVLHLSEHAAYHRIETARAARYFPVILEMIANGDVTPTTVAMLRPHLTAENHVALLTNGRHKTKREVEHQIACLAPKPNADSIVRRIPLSSETVGSRTAAASGPILMSGHVGHAAEARPSMPATKAQEPPPKIESLASDRYLLRVTLTADGHANLRRAQDLLRHEMPSGNPAVIIEKALVLLVGQLERQKVAKVARPRLDKRKTLRNSRHIPAAVRRAVWARDGGQCAFAGAHGRCRETGRLEFHHVIPFAHGGPATVENIALRCRAHNSYESDQLFGAWQRPSRQSRRASPEAGS
jgi:5-methylcytosine-specific restriction endonuclease McrA